MLRGEPVNSIIKEIEQHDDFHNRDDCYLGHSESTYIIEYIKKLEAIVDLDAKIRKENHELIHKLNDANNIIDELEKDLEDIFYGRGQHFMDSSVVPIKYVLDKLKELKGEN